MRRPVLMRMGVFGLLTTAFLASAAALPAVLFHFSRLLPDNYQYIARQAIARDDFATAVNVAKRRIDQFCYDFEAHYLLADALGRQGEPGAAAQVMKQVLAKVPATHGRQVDAVGYDEARTLFLLSCYLWESANYFEAGEMARAALDAGTPAYARELAKRMSELPPVSQAALAVARVASKMENRELFEHARQALEACETSSPGQMAILKSLWREEVEEDQIAAESALRAALDELPADLTLQAAIGRLLRRRGLHGEAERLETLVRATTGTRTVGVGLFELPRGASRTTHTLHLGRNSEARALVNTGVFKESSLLLTAQGSQALGLYPIVVVKSGQQELVRLYVDAPQTRLYDLPLWPAGAPKSLDLRFEFLNDAYDPVTRADRNVSVSHLLLH